MENPKSVNFWFLLLLLICQPAIASAQNPNIISVFPSANELNASQDGNITVTFDIDMDESTINNSSFVVGTWQCGLTAGSISYGQPTKRATFNPDNDFIAGEVVSVVLTSGIESSLENPLVAGYAWTFTVIADDGTGAYVEDSAYFLGEDKDPWGIDAADYDADGDFDIAVTSSPDSIIIFSNNGSGIFSPFAAVKVGDGPRSIASADLNNDGNLDLAVPCNYTFDSNDSINILFGDGNGNFGPPSVYLIGRSARTIFAADYNGDGYIDMATANHDSEDLSVLLNNGDGTFADQVLYAAGEYPDALFAADLDGDGDFDLTHTNQYTSELKTYFNDGDGSFTFDTTYESGVYPQSSHIADVDSDGDNDIIIGNRAFYTTGGISIFLNNGDGTFAPRTEYFYNGRPTSVYAADLDGDGDLDVAAANSGEFNVTILEGNGDGSFAATYTYEVGEYPQVAFPADFDGDGDIDLATPNWGTDNISILLNKFNLQLEPNVVEFSATVGGTNPLNQFISIESNGDPLEILTSDDAGWLTISTDYSTTPAVMTLSLDISGLTPDNYMGEITILSSEAENAPMYIDVNLTVKQAHNIVSTVPILNELNAEIGTEISVKFDKDMNELSIDNSSFLVRTHSSGLQSGTISYNSGDSSATFSPIDNFKAGEQILVTLTTDMEAYDGTPLDSSFCWSFMTLVEASPGYFAEQTSYPIGDGPGAVFAADIDNDNDFDILSGNFNSFNVGVFINNGDGTFSPDSVYDAGNSPISIYAADFNSDGYIDMAVANYLSADISVFINNGNVTFQEQVKYNVGNAPQSIYGADLDGDGDIDLVTANTDSDNLSVLLNYGDGTFAPQVNYAVTADPTGVTAADFDSDGDIDLAATNSNLEYVSVFLNHGDGTFAVAIDYLIGDGPFAICAADLDADGDLDIATTGFGNISVIFNNGDATFAGPAIYESSDFPQALVAGDIDGDSDLDLAIANFYSMDITVYRNNGVGTGDRFTLDTLYTVGGAPRSIFGADLNDDGLLDLAVGNQFWTSVSILLNQPQIYICGDATNDGIVNILDLTYLINYLYKEGPEPEIMDAGDVDDNDVINLLDVVFLINYLYKGGIEPDC